MRSIVLTIVAVGLTGCGLFSSGTGDDADDDDDGLTTVAVVPTERNRAVDLLFVVDNSGSMAEEQNSLAQSFPLLINVLNNQPGGLPDLHVGVISSNVGSGGVTIGGCSSTSRPSGDDGNLLTNACAGLTGQFISDIGLPDGQRMTNYSGDLSTLFTCMARLGTAGCGFEQHLESMRRALQPGKNPGFLRPEAILAVVIVADEDDCSAQSGGALFGDPTGSVSSTLGPRTSFRCFEFGVQCDNDPNPRAFGHRTGCVPRTSTLLIQDVGGYTSFVRGLKQRSSDVVVAGIIGTVGDDRAADVVPDPDDASRPALAAACTSSSGVAFAGFRLKTFLAGFVNQSVNTICNDNLADPIVEIGAQIRTAIGDACIRAVLADDVPGQPGVQPRCVVTQYREVNGEHVDELVIPSCVDTGAPCWTIDANAAVCPATPGNLEIAIERAGGSAPLGSLIEARCAVAT